MFVYHIFICHKQTCFVKFVFEKVKANKIAFSIMNENYIRKKYIICQYLQYIICTSLKFFCFAYLELNFKISCRSLIFVEDNLYFQLFFSLVPLTVYYLFFNTFCITCTVLFVIFLNFQAGRLVIHTILRSKVTFQNTV